MRMTAMQLAYAKACEEQADPELDPEFILMRRQDEEEQCLLVLQKPGRTRRVDVCGPKQKRRNTEVHHFGMQVEEADDIFDQTLRNYN